MTATATATETATVPCYGGGGGNVSGGGGRTQVSGEAATMAWGIFQSGVSCHFCEMKIAPLIKLLGLMGLIVGPKVCCVFVLG
jgi:hypothetical protein